MIKAQLSASRKPVGHKRGELGHAEEKKTDRLNYTSVFTLSSNALETLSKIENKKKG